MSLREDLIAAIATPTGSGAVGMVRLSGPGTLEALEKFFKTRANFLTSPRTLHLGHVLEPKSGNIVDQALAAYFPGPASFTGEDVAEIQGHGGTTVPRLILEAALASGARMANPGEFTQRAFLNGRISLDQAEAVAELVASQSETEAALAVRHLEGALALRLAPLNRDLLKTLASLTAILDFFDEEWSEENSLNLKKDLDHLENELAEIIEIRKEGRIFRDGLRLVLAGAPNVGKSSLFNTLLGRDRALVSPRAGTTRDYLEAAVLWSGIRVEMVDTAGLHENGEDELEKMGQDRTRQQLKESDLIVWLRDLTNPQTDEADRPNPEKNGPAILEVWNKADLDSKSIKDSGALLISAKTGQGLAELKTVILEKAGVREGHAPEIVPNIRQQKALMDTQERLLAAKEALDSGQPPEIISIELSEALKALGQITGRTMTEDLLAEVFSNFCLGK